MRLKTLIRPVLAARSTAGVQPFGRKSGDAFDPAFLSSRPLAALLRKDHVAEAKPEAAIVAAGECGHGRLFVRERPRLFRPAIFGRRGRPAPCRRGSRRPSRAACCRGCFLDCGYCVPANNRRLCPSWAPLVPRQSRSRRRGRRRRWHGLRSTKRSRSESRGPACPSRTLVKKDVVIAIAVTVEGDPGGALRDRRRRGGTSRFRHPR